MRRRRRQLLLGLSTTAVLLAALGVPGAGVAAEGRSNATGTATDAVPSLLPAGRTYTVTLLTGDVVTVRGASSGCPVVSVRPASPSGVLTRSCGPDGHVRVVPARVAPLIDKVLDPALFDVTALILDGYDDARTKDLPLIVRPGGQVRQLTADPLVAGLVGARALPSIEAVSGRRSKATGADLVRSLSARSATARSSGPSRKVWLDRRVRASHGSGSTTDRLDRNLHQVAAPQAWDAGYTGAGARVAVLDSGVDATHPDLTGQIAEKMDFTVDGGDAADRLGHGTHVAATIAGTGAASGGSRKGVAPGARLVVGKVLDDNGEGTDSQVIAGMEWAASRATVVNMSLGGEAASDGTDPLALALDALSQRTGALFVVAAGNAGPVDGTVSSPGAAASALTVGAVDGDDVLAEFSSRGPLVGTRAAKPELVAPGVDIVAARAAGTTLGRPVDARYTAASGTSMATPHVAGAAAVLAQRHPDWRAGQLKAALVGAADPVSGGDVYAGGVGRLQAARALSGVVGTQPVVHLGTWAYPQSGMAEAKLGWVNTGTGPKVVTLDVAVTDRHGVAAPAGTASLSTGRVPLAAGAGGGVTLRVDRTAVAARPGFYTATVAARVDGRVASRTPVTFYVEPPSFDLTVETTAIPGTPAGASAMVMIQVVNLDDPAWYVGADSGDPGDTLTFRVPAGRYSVMASAMSWVEGDERAAMAGDPDLEVVGDTSVKVDLSQARRLAASVDGVATEAESVGLNYLQTARRGDFAWTDFAFAWGAAARDWNVFVAPNSGVGVGTFRTYAAFGLDAPGSGQSPYLYDLIHPFGNGIPDDPTYRVTAAAHAALARIDQRFNTLDMPNSDTGHKRYGFSPEGAFIAETDTEGLSGDRTDYVSSGFAWLDEAFWNGIVTQEGLARYAPGSRQAKVWIRQPLRSDWYDHPAGSPSGCAPLAPTRTSGNLHVELVTLTDQHQRFDCLADGFDLDIPRTLTLARDGRTVGRVDGSIADFTVPSQAADYRLTYDIDTSAVLPVSTRVTTSWTFRSTGPSGTGRVPLPLLSVDYALPLDAANHPTADGTATFTVHQAHGVRAQVINSFNLSASLDSGATWQPVRVDRSVDGTYRAQLPRPTTGQAVSLRVAAHGNAGSGIEQTIIDAYRAG
ncbi:S8 family serine peptidase [Plantactinospora soyae]|uniref:Subtilisin family serine protease n=1 Tax=Plantactinospora soyae TaxID=1544732 RepID=A0A927QYW6_9ACTN|nr:S8 family serine peptidase [Plantactinospora soyae]MBE1488342.1 subtilisin family serine protease [Plantactinospora soyae]